VAQKTLEQISYNMSRVRDRETKIERILRDEFLRRGITTFTNNDTGILGKPDFSFKAKKIAVFCDSEFWHGYDWDNLKNSFKSHGAFWIPKIEKTIARDVYVTEMLQSQGWKVLRFWGKDLKKSVTVCADAVERLLRVNLTRPYRVIDLCAGIGGIRRGFERSLGAETVLSAEIDDYACKTYEHLFGQNPKNDLTTDEFKALVAETDYEILLAGFPCQTFSRVGLGEGFGCEERGQIFFHISDIIERTRPAAFFLENVDNLITIDKGRTFRTIINELEIKLKYKVIGVTITEDGNPSYVSKDFIRNSRAFGVPQNRPRTYIIGFDRERFLPERLEQLPQILPQGNEKELYASLSDVLEQNVEARYYMASGYLETLERHRVRQREMGNNFGYRIVNEPGTEKPVANTLLATGGSGKERNLIYDPRDGIAGTIIKGKKTPLNDKGIRVMTPIEWGKLQGFINYAFMDDEGTECFSFPEGMPDVQKYKQLGNSVTIPVVEEMARFMQKCFDILYTAAREDGGV